MERFTKEKFSKLNKTLLGALKPGINAIYRYLAAIIFVYSVYGGETPENGGALQATSSRIA
ncbi:MAG: hypothetical protein Fur0025_11200 [Oscillatoriaceae cyanobacterium]